MTRRNAANAGQCNTLMVQVKETMQERRRFMESIEQVDWEADCGNAVIGDWRSTLESFDGQVASDVVERMIQYCVKVEG